MEQCGLDVDDREEYRKRLLLYVNDGYMRLMLDRYKPWVEEDVEVSGETVDWKSLSRHPVKIAQAMQNTRTLSSVLREDIRTVEIPQAEDGFVKLRYYYRPQKLEYDADEPRLPDWAHGALADWATWKMLSGGNQSKQIRAQAFRLTFEETFRRLKPYVPDVSYRKRFINLYS